MVKIISFDGEELLLRKESYEHDKTLAITAESPDGEPYANFTVNLDVPFLGHNEQFFNINMFKGKEILELLIAESIVVTTGYESQSGFVTYPLVKWNFEEENNGI